MKRDDIAYLYDEGEANDWDRRVLLERKRVAFELEVLGKLVGNVDSWLDVSCGSGYYLSKFDEIPRAGFDLSPAMVKVARKANPSAEFIREGDYRVDIPDYHSRWGLVSCMWQAYCYVDTMEELEQVIGNLAAWTSDEGVCFVPFGAPLGKNTSLPYQRNAHSIWGGKVITSGVVWSWIDEEKGKVHKNLIEPHPEHMVSTFRMHFNLVEVIEYPCEGLFAILATEKKNARSSGSMRSIINNIISK